MISVIRTVKAGEMDERMVVRSDDEFGELAATFNGMIGIIKAQPGDWRTTLAQQEKMASLGVLSSGRRPRGSTNPLGRILATAAHLRPSWTRPDPRNYPHLYPGHPEGGANRLAGIVQDLLSYARTRNLPSLERTDLNALLDQIVDFAANTWICRHVTVVRGLRPAPARRALVDPDQIRAGPRSTCWLERRARRRKQVVRSLCGPSPPRVGCVAVIFRDEGRRIAPENLEKVFEPFFNDERRAGPGWVWRSRGVSSSKHLGRIAVESEVGMGTTVTVRLPDSAGGDLNGPWAQSRFPPPFSGAGGRS